MIRTALYTWQSSSRKRVVLSAHCRQGSCFSMNLLLIATITLNSSIDYEEKCPKPPKTHMKQITVVAAVIEHNSQILCVKRNRNKYDYISEKYEFPGGKIENEESEVEALQREIVEELSMDIEVTSKLMIVNHAYPDFTLVMHTYMCACESRELVLHEHIDLQWLYRPELTRLNWAAADIPIVKKLMES